MALKRIGREQKIDLSQFFPDVRLEESLKNIGKRNDILMKYLLDSSKARLQLGLDLKGGVGFTLEADLGNKTAGYDEETANKEKLTKAIEIISTRINSLGVAEPLIRPVGSNRIEVQLPNVNTKDNPDVLDEVKKPARLDFRMVYPLATPDTVRPGEIPPGYEIKSYDHEHPDGSETSEEYFIKRIPEMTGDMIAYSSVQHDTYGKPLIAMRFTSEGRKRFAQVTREIAASGDKATGRLGQLAIVLDGTVYSVPTVKEEIDSDSAEITGYFTEREAFNLANVLNNPLDLPLIVKSQYEVGPSLAEDAVASGIRASVIGLAAVAAFMITFYTTGGLVAVVTLAVNLIIILGVMANIGATMTLPGLAGIVLTIGMAVDANILIFERMREEIAVGKSLSTANQMRLQEGPDDDHRRAHRAADHLRHHDLARHGPDPRVRRDAGDRRPLDHVLGADHGPPDHGAADRLRHGQEDHDAPPAQGHPRGLREVRAARRLRVPGRSSSSGSA